MENKEDFLAIHISNIIYNTSQYKIYSSNEMLDILVRLLKDYNKTFNKDIDIPDQREKESIRKYRDNPINKVKTVSLLDGREI